MSDSKAKDSDPPYSSVDEVIGSSDLYEAPDNSTANPAYGCIILDKTAVKKRNPERLPPTEQGGSVSNCYLDANEGRNKVNVFPLKNGVISPTYLIALVVTVILLIDAGIAIIIAFVEIFKLRSEVAILQSTYQI